MKNVHYTYYSGKKEEINTPEHYDNSKGTGYPNDKVETINLKDFDPNSIRVEYNYDFINPNHYKKFSYEVIEMMEAIWGKEATAKHCEMCAFKYRLRMGEKPDQPIERDLEKVNWYLNKAAELRK